MYGVSEQFFFETIYIQGLMLKQLRFLGRNACLRILLTTYRTLSGLGK